MPSPSGGSGLARVSRRFVGTNLALHCGSEDRVRALGDERVNGLTSEVDAAFVDRRIEQFDTSDESRLLLSGYGSAQ